MLNISQLAASGPNDSDLSDEDDNPSDVEHYDHESPGTHEEVQESQGELGAPKADGKPKKKRKIKTLADEAAAALESSEEKPKKKAKKAKTPKEPKPKKERKPRAKKAPKEPKKGPGRGIRADGKPRRKPGTNPPKSEEAAKYGRKVAKLRAAAGMTQAQLAEKCGFGQPTIANIERGTIPAGERKINGEPSAKARLAKALKEPSLGPKE